MRQLFSLVGLGLLLPAAALAGYVNNPVWAGVTLDPASAASSAGLAPILSNGNLTVNLRDPGTAGAYTYVNATKNITTTDKVYLEVHITATSPSGSSSNLLQVGLDNVSEPTQGKQVLASIECSGYVYTRQSGASPGTYQNYVAIADSRLCATGDTLQIAADGTTGNVWLGIDGTWIGGGNPVTGVAPTYTSIDFGSLGEQIYLQDQTGSSATATVNFGATAFTYNDPYPVYVPEPASLCGLAAGVVLIARRRRFTR